MSTAAVRTKPMRSRTQIRKKRKPSIHRVEMLLGLLFLAVVASLFIGYITQSSTFRVKRVLFEGMHVLPEQDILLAAGITTDDNIIFLDTESVEKRVEDLERRQDISESR